MLNEKDFLKLVADNNGFEVTLGFRDDIDHFLGGTGNKLWYFVKNKSAEDYYVCTLQEDGSRVDVHYKCKKEILSAEPATSGITLELIVAELSVEQDEVDSSKRKPTKVSLYEHPCSHYSFAFGERACKISDEYGVTVEYSNLNDEAAGFRLRDLRIGPDVIPPREQ